MSGFYSLKAELPGGKTYDFEQLKGKVVLIVNVASQWCANISVITARVLYPHSGFTPQYKGLQALYDKYKDRGFEILGFPCNQVNAVVPLERSMLIPISSLADKSPVTMLPSAVSYFE